jgi:hypothetical protein
LIKGRVKKKKVKVMVRKMCIKVSFKRRVWVLGGRELLYAVFLSFQKA